MARWKIYVISREEWSTLIRDKNLRAVVRLGNPMPVDGEDIVLRVRGLPTNVTVKTHHIVNAENCAATVEVVL